MQIHMFSLNAASLVVAVAVAFVVFCSFWVSCYLVGALLGESIVYIIGWLVGLVGCLLVDDGRQARRTTHAALNCDDLMRQEQTYSTLESHHNNTKLLDERRNKANFGLYHELG
jgi:hypothetical protein